MTTTISIMIIHFGLDNIIIGAKIKPSMTAKSIVLSYPGVFGVVSDELSEVEYLRIISGCQSKGSDIQKASFGINDHFSAMWKLFDLGFTKSGVNLAEKLIELSSSHHFYHIGAEVCKYLHRHYFKYEDMKTANYYDELFMVYHEMNLQEYQAQKLYLKVIYNDKHGLDVSRKDVKKSLELIKEKMKLDSCEYHYYYFQTLSIVSKDESFKDICNKAIEYFQNLYFKHDAYVNIFRIKLTHYYIENKEFKLAKFQLSQILEVVKNGSSRWFNALYLKTDLLIKEGKFRKASNCLEKVLNHPNFDQRPKDHIEQWKILQKKLSLKVKENNIIINNKD